MSGAQFERSALAVARAAYQLDVEHDQWLGGLLEAAMPALDQGLGLLASTFQVREGKLHVNPPVVRGPVPEQAPRFIQHDPSGLDRADVEATWAHPIALETASTRYHTTYPDRRFADWDFHKPVRDLGICDMLAAKRMDPDGFGCILLAPSPVEFDARQADARLWMRVMAHVMAGLRLRSGVAEQDEAVVDPSGRVVHASGEATARSMRDILRDAAVRADRASRRPRDPAAALEDWRALVAGRWSLVDQFESDGRRYLVARRNDPDVVALQRLSSRERQIVAYAMAGHSNKHIAYTLGLAPSTVSSHLRAAMLRLGANTRADLARIWMAESSKEIS